MIDSDHPRRKPLLPKAEGRSGLWEQKHAIRVLLFRFKCGTFEGTDTGEFVVNVVFRHAPPPTGRVPSESTFALTCQRQIFHQKTLKIQIFFIFFVKNLFLPFFCSTFAADY